MSEPVKEIRAAQITMGRGLVDVSRIEHEGRAGILFRPRAIHIPVGEPGELPPGEYWPVDGDVVIWIENEGGAQVIRTYLMPFHGEADITDDLHAALRPFVVYAPEECFEGSKRFSLVETTEAGGGWFGTEDFRRAKEALMAAETAVQRPDLLTAARQMVSDYQTSEHHHPNHVLVPLSAFKAMQDAIAANGGE